MKKNTFIFYFLIAGILLLAGCATNLPTSTLLSSGRFSITTHQKTHVERNSGFYQLYVSKEGVSMLKIKGPLGATVATLEQNKDQATLTYSDGKTITASSSRALIHNLLGISFSMEQLIALLEGSEGSKLPVDKSLNVSITKNEQGSVEIIKANGILSAHEGDFSLVLLPNSL